MKNLSKLEKKLGIAFKNQDFLRQALVHRSYINEHPGFVLGHNERLEFLGDAVLELVVTEYLYNNYDNPEGDLTNWRASLVNAKMLSEVAKELDIDTYLYLSKGETKDTGKARQFILADTLEAIIGAIYLDQKMKKSTDFIKEKILIKLPYILEHELYLDPKSKFQELAQEKYGITPSYKVLEESGPDHARKFIIGVFLDKKKITQGQGSSKQEAQIEAAAKALEKSSW